ncbi:hypothetical protein ACFWWT_33550 [Streptomyces sp. NPDC058676]|uniref:hypothetical protein n=1 Tax=unclassified Streptomyces TaxID=2593676 RepID=UPI00364F7910
MWPGEQPPGGGQNPQQPPADRNPYQQPGYQQANPYVPQQPAPWEAPTAPGGVAVPGPPGGGRRTKVVAITVAAAVVVASAVTGAVLLGGGTDDQAGPGPTNSPASGSPSASRNPRTADDMLPTVAGWKVVVNPDLGVAFDVPPDWALRSTSWVSWVAEDDDPEEKPLVAMKAPAFLKEKWCGTDDDKDGETDYSALAGVGTRGNNGAKSTEAAARADSSAWVYGGYTQPDRKKVTTGPVTSFTTASGLTGTAATSTSSGVAKKGKCDTDGKATTFAFKDADGDFASWSFVGAAGVGDEVPAATVEKIMKTVRLYTSGDER